MDMGELLTLVEAGVFQFTRALSSKRFNNGHGVGFQASINFESGGTGLAQSIYFQTDSKTPSGPDTGFYAL